MELLDAPLRGRDRAHRLPAVALLPAPGPGAPGRRARPRRRPDAASSAPSNVYFEVQNNGIPEQDKANEGIARIARELGRPLVGTADVHYLRREDYDNHSALLCVQTKSTLDAAEAALRHERVLSSRAPRRWRSRSPPGPRRCRPRSRSPSAATSRSSSASCCCRASRPRTARSRGEMLRRLADEGLRAPLRRPAARRGASSGSSSSSA